MSMVRAMGGLSLLDRLRRWSLWPLVGLGLAFEAILLVGFTLAFPLWQLYVVPKLDLGLASGDSLLGALRFAGAVVAMSALYLIGWWWTKRLRLGHDGLALIFVFGALFAVTLIFLYPINSRDLFYYVYLTRLIGVYRSSPFGPLPEDVEADIVFPYLDWATLPMPYGPLWALVSRWFAAPKGWDLLSTLLAYKGLAAFLFLVSGLLIYWSLAKRKQPNAALAAQLWLWNPLVLLEWVGNGHNDGLMVALLLAAVLSLVTGWGAAAMALLALSAGIKYVSLLLFPIWLWQLLRARRGLQERASFLVLTLGVALVIVWLTSSPWARSPTSLGFLRETEYLGLSVAGLFRALLTPFVKGDPSRAAFLLAATISLLAIAALCWREWRAKLPSSEATIRLSYKVMVVFVLLAAPTFHAWYLSWVIALGVLLGDQRTFLQIALFSFGGLILYVVQFFLAPSGWSGGLELKEGGLALVIVLSAVGAGIYAIWGHGLMELLAWLGIRRTSAPQPLERAAEE